MQPAARQNVRGHHQIELVLLERRLGVKRHAGFKIHLHLRPFGAEVFQRRGQPLNTAMALNGDTQTGLLWFVAGLQRAVNLWQNLTGQLQQDLTLWGETQRLTFTYE